MRRCFGFPSFDIRGVVIKTRICVVKHCDTYFDGHWEVLQNRRMLRAMTESPAGIKRLSRWLITMEDCVSTCGRAETFAAHYNPGCDDEKWLQKSDQLIELTTSWYSIVNLCIALCRVVHDIFQIFPITIAFDILSRSQ